MGRCGISKEKLINVNLYGDGSRNARRRAEYIYCDHADECSAYADGKCFRVTTLFGLRCEFGRVSCVDGGTKQSKMFHRIGNEAKSNEQYHKLSYPYHTYITRIGDGVLLTPPRVRIELEGAKLVCSDPGFGSNRLFVPLEAMTPENIKRICECHPRALMGGEITDYQQKTIPMFLYQLSKLCPEQFKAFTTTYPDFNIKPPTWIGRYAKLSTCNRKMMYKDDHGNPFYFDGDDIVCDSYRSSFLAFGGEPTKIRIAVTDSMEVKITDNSQVTDNTVFV